MDLPPKINWGGEHILANIIVPPSSREDAVNSILDRVRARTENGVYTGYAKNDVIALVTHLSLLTGAARDVLRGGETEGLRSALEYLNAPVSESA